MKAISEQDLIDCIERIRDHIKVLKTGFKSDNALNRLFENCMEKLVDPIFSLDFYEGKNSCKFKLKFGRLVLRSDTKEFKEVTIDFSDFENSVILGTVHNSLDNIDNTMYALMSGTDLSTPKEEELLRTGANLLGMIRVFDAINQLAFPANVWVPAVSPEAVEWLRRYEVDSPFIRLTREGLKVEKKVKEELGQKNTMKELNAKCKVEQITS